MRFAFGIPLLILLISASNNVQAQSNNTAGAGSAKSEEIAVAKYHVALSDEGHLFSGAEFISYPASSGEHQFYKYNKLQEASIIYEGLEYKQIPLLYDIVNDDVIVGRFSKQGATQHIKIDKNRVSSFNLSGHSFIHLRENGNALTAGFYELLYQGKLQVLAKRKKIFKKEVVTVTFPADNYYYLLKDGTYHAVKSKGSVLKVLKDHKKELSQFLKVNNIIFYENREVAIAKLAEQYDLLTQAK